MRRSRNRRRRGETGPYLKSFRVFTIHPKIKV
jgi:hypothetical protein